MITLLYDVLRPCSWPILAAILFAGCQNQESGTGDHADSGPVSRYATLEGIWKCTRETALKFPNGTLEPVILIGVGQQHEVTVRGCFLWDSHYYDEWALPEIHFDKTTRQLKLTDGNNSTYHGMVDRPLRKIRGVVYSGDPNSDVPEDSLDFIRADPALAGRLFFPRPPGLDGSMTCTYDQPEQMKDGLPTAPVFDFVADTSALIDFMARLIGQEYGRLESLLVCKDGKLVIEEYYYGYGPAQLHNIHSCTKSVTSLLLGIALEHHQDIHIDQSIFSFFPAYDSLETGEKAKITLKHVLTMTSGFKEEENTKATEYRDKLQYFLSRPMASHPGKQFRYSNDDTDLLGYIIHSLEGRYVDEYAEENLFGPMGITEYYWETENGIPHCHSDLYLLPRDMAKIGLLVLFDGKWKDQQLVPKTWIDESTQPHVAESIYYDYGYQWWHRSKENVAWWKEGKARIPTEHDKFIALGYGGQYIVIIRDLNMVIVTTASDYADGRTARSKIPMVIEEIVPLFAGS